MSDRRPNAAGKRDRYGTMQQLTQTIGASRRPVEDWTLLFQMWAYREDRGGRERFIESQQSAPFDTRWEVDYRPEIDPEVVDVPKTRRWVYQGRVYEIVAASQIGRKDGVEFFTLSGGVVQ